MPLPAAQPGPGTWSVARCVACGTGTTLPWPTDSELEAAYGTSYRPGDGRFAGPGDRILTRTRGLLAKRIDHIAPGRLDSP